MNPRAPEEYEMPDACKVRFVGIEGKFGVLDGAVSKLFTRQWQWFALLISLVVIGGGVAVKAMDRKVSDREFNTHLEDASEMREAYQETRDAVIRIEAKLEQAINGGG